jgi:hypothetical protein
MMKSKILITVFLLTLFIVPAKSQEQVNLSGFLRNYTGVLTGQGNEGEPIPLSLLRPET